MSDSNGSITFETVQSLNTLPGGIRQPRSSDPANRMPAPVDMMILRALLSKPLVTEGEARAAAEKAAQIEESFPFSLTRAS